MSHESCMKTLLIRDLGYNEFFSRDCSDAVLLPSLTFKSSGVVGGGHGISATRPFVRGQNKSCFPDACPHLCFSWYATKLFLSGSLSLFLSHVSLLSLSLFLSFNFWHFFSLSLFVSYIIFHSYPVILLLLVCLCRIALVLHTCTFCDNHCAYQNHAFSLTSSFLAACQ